MKICMLTSGHNVYDSRIYYKEILSLKKYYNEIYLIAPGERNFTTRDGIKVLSFKKRKYWFDRIRPMKDMLELAKGIQADVYHAHEPDSLGVAIKLKEKTGAKIIYDSHEYYPESFSEHFPVGKKLAEKCIYNYEKHLAEKADCVITVNNLLVNKFKRYSKNVVLLPNYPVFSEKVKKKVFNKIPTFVYVGGLSEERGILNILKSIKLVNGNYKYIFVGQFWSEEFKNKVFAYINKNLRNKDIIFTGKIPHPEVAKYLEDASAGFVLLRSTNWRYVNSEPIKLFEYMQNRVPVIASDFPMMRAIVNESNCGVLVNPEDTHSIARAIENIANNSQDLLEIGQNGYKSAKKKYNWKILEPAFINMYKDINDEEYAKSN